MPREIWLLQPTKKSGARLLASQRLVSCQATSIKKLLFGTDFPFQPGELFQTTLDYIRRAGLPEEDVNAILARNAATLFGLQDVKRPT
ncbi:amidohydrolase family protein [Serratia sp. CY54781]|uniref:amidohydrolase family protein n=1 Tax=Serratia TaxID=613 RepID=UPI001F5C65D7|nr:amidohydrolase family protein [Serratia marcescens]